MIYFHLLTAFLRIGAFSFGGGLAMLPLIFQSVRDFGMMTPQDFSDLVALSQVTPGPIAVNAATFVGFNYAGLPGALVATFGVCLPAFVIMLTVMKFIDKFKTSKGLEGIFFGIRPVTIGLIGAAAVFVSDSVLVKGSVVSEKLITGFAEYINIIPCCIFVITLILAGKFKINPIVICIIMGVVGAIVCG